MNKNIKLILGTIALFFVVIVGLRVTGAYFSDSGQSTTNTFAAAAIFPSPTPSVVDHLVISEVQINGSNANQDFIEIYNPTASDVNLNNWKLRKKTSPGTESSLVLISNKTIFAHGFFLWANDQGGFNTTVGADVFNGNNISENNSVALLNNSDVIVDQVAWGNGSSQFVEGTAFGQSPATNQSVERKAYATSTDTSMISGADISKGNGFDANNNSTDFILRTTSQPQKTTSPTETP